VIAGVVLAAGASSRLGSPKQLLRVGGRSLVGHAAGCCSRGGCAHVAVVLGALAERIRPALRDLPVDLVHNENWREGIASSIRAGIASLPREVDAALLVTADQPRLTADVVRRLIEAYDGTPACMVACEYAGTLGVPALFARGHFDELLRLRGDRGARRLLRNRSGAVVRVPWPDGALDVDRPADLGKI
jgi:molybdenum cofactor cytidylyltransferase